VSPRAQGPDLSGVGLGLHHQPAQAGHQHSIMLFTARLQQRQPLPTKNRAAIGDCAFSVAAPCAWNRLRAIHIIFHFTRGMPYTPTC